MIHYDNEKTIAFYAADTISTQGYYILNAEQLQKKRNSEEEIKIKIKSFQQKLNSGYLSCGERLLLISKIYQTLGRDLAIEKLLLHPTEKEKFICFNELVRQSTNEDGTRYITGEKSVFDISNLSFALLYEQPIFQNDFTLLFNMLFGKTENCRYAPIEEREGKIIEREVSKNKFSNPRIYDKRIYSLSHQEFVGKEFKVEDYYRRYKEKMLILPSDLISEYFDKYKGSVTRAELGTIYHDYFIPDEMSKFTYRIGKSFPRY